MYNLKNIKYILIWWHDQTYIRYYMIYEQNHNSNLIGKIFSNFAYDIIQTYLIYDIMINIWYMKYNLWLYIIYI